MSTPARADSLPRARESLRERLGRQGALAAGVLVGLAAGGVLHLLGHGSAGDITWAAITVLVLVPLTVSVLATLARGDVGVDSIALLAMAVAVVLGEYLAGALVALMLTGGNALESYASGRARRELHALLARAPRSARRYRDGSLEEIPVEAIEPGDLLLVATGGTIPADGVVEQGSSSVDASALTGESVPQRVRAGSAVASGALNVGKPLDVRASRSAEESTYAGIIRLVRAAETERPPFVRLADRYAMFFLPVTLLVAGLAWGLSGDEVRALAVLVVATPCPLILAAPIAIISGVSRAAGRGIVVKGGGAIEALGEVQTVLLDKTGTLTRGEAEIREVRRADRIGEEEIVRLAASLDQASSHVLAEALVADARRRGLDLELPREVEELPGEGIAGSTDSSRVELGRAAWLRSRGVEVPEEGPLLETGPGESPVAVAVDGRLAGVIVLADELREDGAATLQALRGAGIERLALLTGDTQEVAARVAAGAGLDEVYADCAPADKLEVVRRLKGEMRGPVLMVGDGVNDAPALALADVGIAMGARGATAASESADAVLTVDEVGRVADAVRIGRRSMRIARQSILVGMGLSLAAMGFAALGHIPPVAGALLQEAIDVLVILNALRALRPGAGSV